MCVFNSGDHALHCYAITATLPGLQGLNVKSVRKADSDRPLPLASPAQPCHWWSRGAGVLHMQPPNFTCKNKSSIPFRKDHMSKLGAARHYTQKLWG